MTAKKFFLSIAIALVIAVMAVPVIAAMTNTVDSEPTHDWWKGGYGDTGWLFLKEVETILEGTGSFPSMNAAAGDDTAIGNTTGDIQLTTDNFDLISADGHAQDASPATDGRRLTQIIRTTYDFTEDGGAVSTIGLGESLPDNAIVTRAYYEVITTFTSSGDNATVALTIPTDDAGGLLAAVAIDGGGNPWDAGYHECIQDGTAAAFSVKTTAAREISATIAVEEVTAGKFVLWLEYVVSD